MIALLGRCDHPTDAVQDYCRCLAEALKARGFRLELESVNWPETGWLRSIRHLWRKTPSRQWALVQYTALGWSRRGFPSLFLAVLLLLRLRKARLAVVFHDTEAYAGRRLVDSLRHACQLFVMRCAYRLADASILCVPLEGVSWLPEKPRKASFIPIGANIPASVGLVESGHEVRTIAVFAITDAGDISKEVSDIAFTAKAAAERVPHIRLVTLGRGSQECEARFRQALAGSAVEYSALGLLPAIEVSRVLSSSDLALFVRGPISTRRGSAVASIACGVPLVAYAGPCLPAPLAEAGVVGVRDGDREALAGAAVRVLSDRQLWAELHERSQRAHQTYFSWEAVAGRFVEMLNHA